MLSRIEKPINLQKQLIILINPTKNDAMGSKLGLFLNHTLARGKALNATNSAIMIIKKEGTNQVEALDVKNYNFFDSELFSKDSPREKKLLIDFQDKMHPLDETASYDEIVIIGSGVPLKGSNTYASINGLRNNFFPSLVTCIKNIIGTHLKDNGHVRVQICHAATKSPIVTSDEMIQEQRPLSECIQVERKNFTIHAPSSYSVISPNDGRAIDVAFKGTSNQFDEFAKHVKKFLNYKNSNDYIRKMTQIFVLENEDKYHYTKIIKNLSIVNPQQEEFLIETAEDKVSFKKNKFGLFAKSASCKKSIPGEPEDAHSASEEMSLSNFFGN
ncbi:hypothetical protein [Legionella longbeachae]|uniref:hypothetical protein n=1 Tax=Legionella longbeachae TaxID=450 RepID=UPI0001BEC2A1|nr:hypothetical protein [Legionella longbeachae]VEE03346.1 Uncharacterised protein [Legionella oakridgensis]HBD7399196.1 hypothetical protein [Legionella pneumophila]ARB93757.1 hypothetical protein A6J40_16950 [Legionella longbeachae]ARM33103.1 hypothetical protein B0B39_06005 [Legionella longbeachae]EEZ94060.1 hypothetical protein LLB_2959 [Legionella longbeachae D-4968]